MIVTTSTEHINAVDFREGATLLINKEIGWTSFDVVAKVRSLLSKKYKTKKLKVGHGGTLDPLADGLMVIGVGPHTKQLQNYQDDGKEYIAELKFGAITPTYDRESEECEHFSIDGVTRETIIDVLKNNFSGDITQMPPIFSAKSINGKRAYDLARNGEEVDLKLINVTIFDIELISFELPYATIRVSCSKGTYIRSIANDIGKMLNSGAYLTKLTRTRSGSFLLKDAFDISEFKKQVREEEIAL